MKKQILGLSLLNLMIAASAVAGPRTVLIQINDEDFTTYAAKEAYFKMCDAQKDRITKTLKKKKIQDIVVAGGATDHDPMDEIGDAPVYERYLSCDITLTDENKDYEFDVLKAKI